MAMAALDPTVEQLDDAIHPIGVAQVRQIEQKIRPLLPRRQAVACERVKMTRWNHGCRPSIILRYCRVRPAFALAPKPGRKVAVEPGYDDAHLLCGLRRLCCALLEQLARND